MIHVICCSCTASTGAEKSISCDAPHRHVTISFSWAVEPIPVVLGPLKRTLFMSSYLRAPVANTFLDRLSSELIARRIDVDRASLSNLLGVDHLDRLYGGSNGYEWRPELSEAIRLLQHQDFLYSFSSLPSDLDEMYAFGRPLYRLVSTDGFRLRFEPFFLPRLSFSVPIISAVDFSRLDASSFHAQLCLNTTAILIDGEWHDCGGHECLIQLLRLEPWDSSFWSVALMDTPRYGRIYAEGGDGAGDAFDFSSDSVPTAQIGERSTLKRDLIDARPIDPQRGLWHIDRMGGRCRVHSLYWGRPYEERGLMPQNELELFKSETKDLTSRLRSLGFGTSLGAVRESYAAALGQTNYRKLKARLDTRSVPTSFEMPAPRDFKGFVSEHGFKALLETQADLSPADVLYNATAIFVTTPDSGYEPTLLNNVPCVVDRYEKGRLLLRLRSPESGDDVLELLVHPAELLATDITSKSRIYEAPDAPVLRWPDFLRKEMGDDELDLNNLCRFSFMVMVGT